MKNLRLLITAVLLLSAAAAHANQVPIDFDDRQVIFRHVQIAVELNHAFATIQGSQHGFHDDLRPPEHMMVEQAFAQLRNIHPFLPTERLRGIVADFYAEGIKHHYGDAPPPGLTLALPDTR